MSARAVSRYIILIVLAVVLSLTTVIFGPLPMRLVRRCYGRNLFWLGFIAASLGVAALVALPYGLLVLALAVAVGVYAEIEEHGGSVFTSGFTATLTAIGLSTVTVGVWALRTKAHVIEDIRTELVPVVDKIAEMNSSATVSVDSIIQQLPSGMVIGVILGLAISLIAEARMSRFMGVKPLSTPVMVSEQLRLSSYRVPDIFIWLSIVSLFGGFFRHGVEVAEIISINALNVLVICYFFQGLAIASRAFRVYKISAFWRNLWYVILVLQLFLLVSLVGFADFWLDFRERLARRPAQPKGFKGF